MGKRNKSRRHVVAPRPASVIHDERSKAVWVCIFLVALVAIVYGQTVRHDFINYDDDGYVTENVHVLNGLNWPDVKWAFTTGHTGYSHPVTWLTHQLDAQLYGTWAGGHHLTSLIIHAINAVLLFLFFWRTTHKLWPSAFVAAIFAIHPLHVESVAWVAERKDVLSGLFFLLTLHAYVRYVAKPEPSRYGLALGLFVLGILSKPMLVTVPCVLLLLDYWPLCRIKIQQSAISIQKLLLEKLPFAIVTMAWSVTTFVLQGEYGALAEDKLGFGMRAANAIVNYGIYLWKTVWPHDLALFYPYPRTIPVGVVLISAAVLALISILCIARWKKSPPLIVGWLWYVGMLVPVIGFIQFGEQARADRYTYLPQIGICILATWGVLELSEKWPRRREILAVASLIVIATFTVRGFIQASFWRNNETLWNHSIAVTSGNYIAENNLGNHLSQKGRMDEAVIHFRKALEISPHYPEANNNLGTVLTNEGRWSEATAFFELSLKYRPDHAKTHSNIGVTLTELGKMDEALAHFHEALRINPDLADAHYNLARALLMSGRRDEAVAELKEALRLRPDDADVKARLRELGGER